MYMFFFAVAGMLLILLAELSGQLRVKPFDVSRRFVNKDAWRKAQGFGVLFVPCFCVFWFFVLLTSGGYLFIDRLFSLQKWTFIFGISLCIMSIIWTRHIIFFFLDKHSEEAERIIVARKQDRNISDA